MVERILHGVFKNFIAPFIPFAVLIVVIVVIVIVACLLSDAETTTEKVIILVISVFLGIVAVICAICLMYSFSIIAFFILVCIACSIS